MNKNHKLLLGLVLFLFVSCFLYSNDIKVIKSNSKELIFEYIPEIISIKEYKTSDGVKFLLPEISNTKYLLKEVGSPIELVKNISFAIPNPESYTVKNVEVIDFNKIEGKIAPYPKTSIQFDISENNYTYNDNSYSKDVNQNWYNHNYSGIAGDVYVGEINLIAAKYNSAYNQIFIPKKIRVHLEFNSASKTTSKLSRNNYDFLINPEIAKLWKIDNNINSKDNNEKLLSEKNNKISELSNGKWLKIQINETGIYKITASQLASYDFNINSNDVKTIKMFSKGGTQLDETVSSALLNHLDEQEIIVNTNANGNLESIIFMGIGTKGFKRDKSGIKSYFNEYTNPSYYLLTFGGREGLRAKGIENSTETPINTPTHYTNRIFFDEDINNPYEMGAGRQWFGRSFLSSPFINQLHDLDRNSNVLYRIAVAHRSYAIYKVTNGDAWFTFFENNDSIGRIDLEGISGYTNSFWRENYFTKSATSIAQDNRSILKLQYNNPKNPNGAIPYIDFFEIHYKRPFLAINNEIEFIADTTMNGLTEFKINNFSGEIYGFEISDTKNPKLLVNRSKTGGMFIFNKDLKTTDYNRYYISSNLNKQLKIEKTTVKGIRENFANTDVIVVTHKDLLASAEKFKTYREQNSELSVSVFTTEEIYNEFAGGNPDITAIRDFIAYSYNNWTKKPRYLVLWGDGHYDFKNISTNNVNYVPAYQTPDFGLERGYFGIDYSFCTDDFYGRIVGNDNRIDIAIGRVPADSPERGLWLADKIKHYEQNSSTDDWRTNLIFIADDGPQSDNPAKNDGSIHTSDSEQLGKIVSNDIQIDKIYMVEYPYTSSTSGRRKPKVTQDLLSAINTRGGIILNYYGHGNPRVWAHENILDRETTIPQMRNLDKLFFLTAATCDFGRFDLTDIKSGSEEMLYSSVGGAIAVLAFTRVVYISDNSIVNMSLYSNLFKREIETGKYLRLGDAMYNVKQTYFDIGDQKFVILGDPTMRLQLPDYKVRIDSINDVDITNLKETIQIKGLSKVRISATIINPLTNMPQTDFNGTAVITMRDGDQYYEIWEKDPWNESTQNLFIFNKFGGALNKSSASVVNGKINSEFIIPKDISFSDSTGRLFVYAFTNDLKSFAKGVNNNFIINGIDVNQKNDNKGPEMAIYLDSRIFKENDIVSNSPLLIVDYFDENGINTTGLGIGHRIEAWIDDSPLPIDLTTRFATSLKDARFGSTENILYNLDEGTHKVRIRAWDVFNNFTVKETYFRISNVNNGPIIKNIYNYPNPYEQITKVRFSHNITPPFDAELKIYNSLGGLIKTVKQRLGTLSLSEIEWNGLDENGNLCPPGAYYFSITASNYNATSTEFGTISVMIR